MDFAALKTFVMVAEQQGFVRAAELLHITQPAVSKRIAGLESQLGIRLFDRIGRTAQLTEAGFELLPRARKLLIDMEDSRRAVTRLSGEVAGKLSIGTSHHIGLHRLPPILRQFVNAHPNVDLDIRFLDSEEGCNLVEQGELELAIVTLPAAPSAKLSTQLVWDDPLAVMVSHQHPLLLGAKQQQATHHPVATASLAELAAYPAILPSSVTYTHAIVKQAVNRLGVDLQVRMETNYLETIRMMVSIGLGWSTLPLTMFNSEVEQLNIPELRLSRSLGTVVHIDRTLSNAGEKLLAMLQDTAAE